MKDFPTLQASIRQDLMILWLAITAVSLVLCVLLLVLIRQGAGPQIARATYQASVSCEALRAGAERMEQTALNPATPAYQAVLDLALRDQAGIEGGFWDVSAEVVAYAFPTYDGTGVNFHAKLTRRGCG